MLLIHCRLIPELSGGIAAEDGMIICENGRIREVLPETPSTAEEMKNLLQHYEIDYTEKLPRGEQAESKFCGEQAESKFCSEQAESKFCSEQAENSYCNEQSEGKFCSEQAENASRSEKAEDYSATTDVIDCSGMTVIPGLIDAHTHIACLRDYDPVQLRDPMRFYMDTAKRTEHYLDYGFTTIRDCGTPLRVANHVRDGYKMGLGNGPRILAGGLILSPTEIEEKDSLYDIYAWTDGVDSCTRATRKELAQHADFIKVMASGSALHPQGIPVQPIILEEELRAITHITDLKGTYTAAHAHGDGAIRLCVDTGVRTIEHASFISEETIERLLARNERAAAEKAGTKEQPCFLIPTLSAMYQNPETTPPSWQFLVKKLQQMLEISAVCLENAYRSGCPMGFGTDSFWGMEQYEKGLEFQFRSQYCHMKNVDILLQATKGSAEAIGLAGVTGEIKKGLSAEFCLIDGKPDQDISLMYRKPSMVIR